MFRFAPKESPRLKRLRSISLFKGLTLRELSILDLLLHERHYLAGEVIFDAGEEGQGIYLTLDGKVGIYHPEKSQSPLAELGADSFFGEMALLDDSPRMAQARALTDCTLAVMFRGEFLSLLETHALIASKLSLQLARHLGQRLRSVSLAGSVPGSTL
ncbi:hypothetical protein AZSI13_05760 [Azospira sp. I13]|uniref:cyclic nucleotide-binding domain-containing protein n=1 Tax=Azospira sp. I13 TaxID=1765050 RepID=UPI000D4C2A53|nr:cyclic nucleotide-binding domain-containing protein [Azospira sp. I13]GBG01249.1 hypothetical protein AZSI13_05760 [Azospira sp. I13]